MDAPLPKLADLKIEYSYLVLGYRPISTKFGDTYIINCREYDCDNDKSDFQMFATKLMASYISQYTPTNKFHFTVRKNAKYTYAEIPGYNPSTAFIKLN